MHLPANQLRPCLRLLAALLLALTTILQACGQSRPGDSLSGATSDAAADRVNNLDSSAPTAALVQGLPALSELNPQIAGPARSASATDYDLLPYPPLARSSEGVTWSPGSLVLTGGATASGEAWVVYALSGFPTDGSVVPESLTFFRNSATWLALADFGTGRWRILGSSSSGTITLDGAADLVSPDGVFYVALIAAGTNVNVFNLLVSSSLDLTQGPLAVLDYAEPVYAGVATDFSAAGSDGDGADIVECRYDFGDGSPEQSTSSAAELLSHTFAEPGVYPVDLTVTTAASRSALGSFLVPVLADPSFPTAQLNILSQSPTEGWGVQFDAAGSTGGEGTITSINYNWGDGSPDETAMAPEELKQHSYAAPGERTVTLTISNDLGKQKQATVVVDIAPSFKDMLLVYNSDIADSADLALYYASPETGRGIDPARMLGLPLGAGVGPEVSRAAYESGIRDPLKTFIDGSGVKTSLKYLLLFKGVPHRISGAEAFSGVLNDTTCSAVDSELCTLYSDKADADPSGYPNQGALWNSSVFGNWDAPGFYLGRSAVTTDFAFGHQQYQVCDDTGATYPLDYLVGRITGYTWDDARAMVDRGRAADTSAEGWVIFDSSPPRASLDTMVDPVYSNPGQPIPDSGFELLSGAGYQVFADATEATIDAGDADLLPENFSNSVIAMAGWGVNHTGSQNWGSDYILSSLQWNYLPGAAWISYESFNGSDHDSTDGIQRRGQGQIMDFIQMGGSCAIGNVFEPYSLACGDERVAFYRYCVSGDRWIEAAYKSLRLLSWQEVVVGDPLCTVK